MQRTRKTRPGSVFDANRRLSHVRRVEPTFGRHHARAAGHAGHRMIRGLEIHRVTVADGFRKIHAPIEPQMYARSTAQIANGAAAIGSTLEDRTEADCPPLCLSFDARPDARQVSDRRPEIGDRRCLRTECCRSPVELASFERTCPAPCRVVRSSGGAGTPNGQRLGRPNRTGTRAESILSRPGGRGPHVETRPMRHCGPACRWAGQLRTTEPRRPANIGGGTSCPEALRIC